MKNNNKKEIILAWTRDFTLAWAEWWSKQMNPRLIEVIGVGVPNQLSYYNGRLLETYRPLDESKNFIEAVVNLDLGGGFFSEKKIKHYLELIKEIKALIKKTTKKKVFLNQATFKKLKDLSREMYPWYTVSYLLPQEQWAGRLTEKYPKQARDILDRLIDARKQSEGTIEELVEYWRAVARDLLASRGLSAKYISFVTFSEIEKTFDNKNFAPDRKELEARSKSYIFFKDSIRTNTDRQEFFEKYGFSYASPAHGTWSQEVRGTVASIGLSSIKGIVQIILKNDEVGGFKAGNILVTVMTNPFFIPAIKKAVAIVTDEGGITCHAAITARELKKPCIIGTKIATKVFKDGDIVEMDANKGIVRKI